MSLEDMVSMEQRSQANQVQSLGADDGTKSMFNSQEQVAKEHAEAAQWLSNDDGLRNCSSCISSTPRTARRCLHAKFLQHGLLVHFMRVEICYKPSNFWFCSRIVYKNYRKMYICFHVGCTEASTGDFVFAAKRVITYLRSVVKNST